MTFARITTVVDGVRSTMLFQIVHETASFVLATPVDRHGEDRSYYRPDGTLVETRHLIEKTAITKRVPMVMNNHYAELEVQK